jgi:hypothetical protein
LIVKLLELSEEPFGDGLVDLEGRQQAQRLVLEDLLRIETLAALRAGAAIVDVPTFL